MNLDRPLSLPVHLVRSAGRARRIVVHLAVFLFLCGAAALGPQRAMAVSAASAAAQEQPAHAAGPDAAQPHPAVENNSPSHELAEASRESTEGAKAYRLFGKWLVPEWLVRVLRWLNFVLLFGILGWLLRKPMAQFFQQRTQAITEGMRAGRQARDEANARLAQIEARLNGLDAEIARLRSESAAEGEAESARLRQQAEAEAARILAVAQQEIEAAGKAAQTALKRYAASLAVAGAEQEIRGRMKPAVQDQLVKDYAATLERKNVQSRRA